MFKKIVAPVDRTALAPKELKTALSLGVRFDAEVIVLRVMPEAASLQAGESETDLDVIERETQELLAEALAQVEPGTRPSKIQAEVRAGPVLEVILQAAEDHMADLIVVGSHGRHRPIDWLRGSTAEQLVNRASPSVLVVKPDGFPFLTE